MAQAPEEEALAEEALAEEEEALAEEEEARAPAGEAWAAWYPPLSRFRWCRYCQDRRCR